MKKTTILLLLIVTAFGTAHAQFQKGTKYVGASLSGLSMTYSSNERFRMGLDAKAGYFVADCLMVGATVGYEHTKNMDDVNIGGNVRWYFEECGVYLGTGAEYNHFTKSNNDVMIPLFAGYAFFLNQYLTIEPSIYYKMSLHDFSGDSTLGFSLGLGFYI